jgi:hypothetical protein
MNTNLQHRKVAIFRPGLQLFSTRGTKCPTRGRVLTAIISDKRYCPLWALADPEVWMVDLDGKEVEDRIEEDA